MTGSKITVGGPINQARIFAVGTWSAAALFTACLWLLIASRFTLPVLGGDKTIFGFFLGGMYYLVLAVLLPHFERPGYKRATLFYVLKYTVWGAIIGTVLAVVLTYFNLV